ncbi:hypothetical protein [Rhizobium sp. NFR07]|uniref:hypothetical protein n=1 Tax=Rhizobium sp. NFR07 TaxID=1566262 RepID=UPI0011606290|nr:hypothetical protein [Rhizobium sp. NFR07]
MRAFRNAERIGVSMAVGLALCASAAAQPAPRCTMENGKLKDEFRRMVVITDPEVFKSGKFSFKDTIARMLQTSIEVAKDDPDAQKKLDAVSTPKAQRELVATLLNSFWETTRVNREGIVNNATQRPNEAALTPEQLLKDLHPVAIFNRLDLVPASFDHCGEQRVVYALGNGEDGDNRFFLIFEAAVDNPDPNNGVAGCLRIAKFWKGLSGKTVGELTNALKGFYSFGDLGDGGLPTAPVVHNKHYGVPFGQVRGNLFMTDGDKNGNPWMLREWRSQPTATGTSFVPDTVKSNPVPEFYGDAPLSTDGSDHGRRQRFADLRPDFKMRFSLGNVRQLIDLDLEAEANNQPKPDAIELINRLSALFDDKFNDFESISQGTVVDEITRTASGDVKAGIEAELKKYHLPANWKLEPKHILARAEALSCAGCHRLTAPSGGAGVEIAPGIEWPADNGFVHVDENGGLSPALEKAFLPWRCETLHKFIEKYEGAPSSAPVAVAPPAQPATPVVETEIIAEGAGDLATVRGALRDFQSKALQANVPQMFDLAPDAKVKAEAEANAALEGLVQAVEGARQNMGQQSGEFRIGIRTH